jgi:poly(beta-D-mannuronate) lyase
MAERTKIFLFLLLLLSSSICARSVKVSDLAQFNSEGKRLVPGDSIVLANGTWKDVQLVFKGKGLKGRYISLIAENPGKVTLEGRSSLQISGEWLFISGLVFINGSSPGKTVIEFRTGSKDYAFNSVLSDCVIDNYNQNSINSADHWVGVWGKYNKIENCYFGGKTNEGTTLVIWPNDSDCINNNHLVYRNYFGYRPPLGKNGGESIRIGTSDVCKNISATVVEGNYFERCNGEGEIISNKSGANSFLNNTFFECEGTLTLRHGNNAVVAGNWFIGNGKKLTGGVRVINEGHRIYNNFFYRLTGDEYRSALSIMNAIPDSPPAGYAAVRDVIISNNTFLDCNIPWSFCTGSGKNDCTVRPESTLLVNNLVYCLGVDELIARYDKTDGIALENNILINKRGTVKEKGTVIAEVLIMKIGGFSIPYTKAVAKKLPDYKNDISGRSVVDAVIGAFQNVNELPLVELATAVNCGPAWYKPTVSAKR